MSHEPLANCDDPSTWNHKDEKIDLPRLLALIEAHGGPDGLDLHGCDMTGVDLTYGALRPYLERWDGASRPPWVYGIWGINLRGAHLEEAKLVSANLDGAELSLASLKRTFFFNARLDNASLVRCSAGHVSLLHASARQAGFQNANLEEADLMVTDLRDTEFGGANLQRARFRGAHIEGVDFRLADLRGAMLHGARLEKTRMRPGNLGWAAGEEMVAAGKQDMHYKVGFFEAADVYLDLKANFAALGYHGTVSWAYVKERQMEKMACFQEWTRSGRGLFRSPLHWLRLLQPRNWKARRWLRLWLGAPAVRISLYRWTLNWAYELLSGYGERPRRPLAWAAGSALLFFPMLYWVAGALQHNSLWNAVVFSLTTFGTLSFNRLQPVDTLGSVLAASEAFCGVLLFALFVFTLGNRMSRS